MEGKVEKRSHKNKQKQSYLNKKYLKWHKFVWLPCPDSALQKFYKFKIINTIKSKMVQPKILKLRKIQMMKRKNIKIKLKAKILLSINRLTHQKQVNR